MLIGEVARFFMGHTTESWISANEIDDDMNSRTRRNRKVWPCRYAICFLFMMVVVSPSIGWSTSIDVGQGDRLFVPLKSFKALRDHNLIKQEYDYSCGAAALATLLTYRLGDKITEREVLEQVLAELSKNELDLRKKEGLSLLDLQKVAQSRGHKAQGFRLAPDMLTKLRGPVMVFIQPRGYDHFAVLRGIEEDRAYLADPSLGNVRMPLYRFLDMWLDETGKGIIFVVERRRGQEAVDAPLQLLPENLSHPEVLSLRKVLELGNTPKQFLPFHRTTP